MSVKTVDKAMHLLRQFSLEHLELGLSELARATGEDKAVTRRLLVSLMTHGFIEQDPETKKYHLGHGFLALARLREATVPMVRATQIVCQWLCAKTNETVHVGIAGKTGMSTVAYKLPPRGNVINLRPAESYPFHSSASGLAFLTFCTPETRAQIFTLQRDKLTRFTLTDQVDLEQFIQQAHRLGHACTRNTVEDGVASVAMPFFRDGRDPAGTISIAVPDLNLTEDRKDELLSHLSVAVEKLEIALTGRAMQ